MRATAARDTPTNVLSFPVPQPLPAARTAHAAPLGRPGHLRARAARAKRAQQRKACAPTGRIWSSTARCICSATTTSGMHDARRMERREIGGAAALRHSPTLTGALSVARTTNTTGRWLTTHHPERWRASRRTARSSWRACARRREQRPHRRRCARDARGRARGGRPAGARHHGAAHPDGLVRRDEPPPQHPARVVIESGHSRFPVMDDDRDDIVGILLAKDLLRHFAAERAGTLRHPRVHAPGGVRAGVEAAQRAAEGVPPQPQSHGDRRRRIRRRARAWSPSRTSSSRSSARSTMSSTSRTIRTSVRRPSASSLCAA